MNIFQQTLHIFRKDLRSTWILVLAYICSLALMAYIVPDTWEKPGYVSGRLQMWWFLPVILAWVLTVVSIQQEPLVSNRSYWLTRPYHRQALLLAKSIYAASVILLPLIIIQWILLKRARFSILPLLPLQCASTCTLAFFLLLFATTAIVARSFLFSLFTLIGIIVYVAAFMTLLEFLTGRGKFSPSIGGPWTIIALIFICAIAVIVQYFSRRKGFARLLLVTTILLVTLPELLSATDTSVRLNYPYGDQTLSLEYANDKELQMYTGKAPSEGWVPVHIPIIIHGPVADNEFRTQGVRISLRNQNGTTWSTGWRSDYRLIRPDSASITVPFSVPRSEWLKFSQGTTRFTLEYAYIHSVLGPMQKYKLGKPSVEIPGLGKCMATSDQSELSCRRAFQNLRSVILSAQWTEGECGMPGSRTEGVGEAITAGAQDDEWPVSLPGIYFDTFVPRGGLDHDAYTRKNLHLCQGNEIGIKSITSEGGHAVKLDADLNLKDYSGEMKQEFRLKDAPPESDED